MQSNSGPQEHERVQLRGMADLRKIACLLFSLCSLVALPAVAQTSVVINGSAVSPFQIEVWAANVTGARGLVIDDAGDVLVVATGLGGIYALWEEDDGQLNRTLIVNNSNLNHGITLQNNYLYASSSSTVWRWSYRAAQRSEASGQETVVVDINQNELGVQTTTGHVTRSLAIDTKGILYVTVGSTSNVDTDSFRARMRSFNLSALPSGGFDFVANGTVFADGLRNEVGLGFDGQGRLWGVENGADNLDRQDLGGDIHDNNPGEELNLFNNTAPGTFYGYPFCWSEYLLPKYGTGPGSQWAWPTLENGTITDTWCKNVDNVRPPVLAMQAHSAPLGIAFYNGTNCGNPVRNSTNQTAYAVACEFAGDAFVAFHGSWDRTPPTGYKVVRIAFDKSTGLPVAKNDSAVFDVFGAQNPGQPNCLRPVDVKFDKTGALLVTSDATGEIIRVTSSSAAGVVSPASAPSPSSSSAARCGSPVGFEVAILVGACAQLLAYSLWWHQAL